MHLDAFGTSAQDEVAAGPAAPEPTAFDTSFAPFGAAFDTQGQPPTSQAPAEEPGSAAAPGFGAFTETVDGPVFDVADAVPGPAFDVGGTGQPKPVEPAAPSFDLAEGAGHEPVAAAGPAFDLGGDEPLAAEPAKLDFDLEDEAPAAPADQPATPAFDLGDAEPPAAHGPSVQAPSVPQAGSMEEAVFQAISGVLVELANEVRRSVEYYATRYSKTPTRIFLCGGTAKMPNLAEFLSRELGVPVEVADPVKNLRVNVPGCSPQYLREISPLFPVCIGLAIRDMVG